MMACDKAEHGCQGGYPEKAWKFLAKTGTFSEACVPYNLTRQFVCPLSQCEDSAHSSFMNQTRYKAKASESYVATRHILIALALCAKKMMRCDTVRYRMCRAPPWRIATLYPFSCVLRMWYLLIERWIRMHHGVCACAHACMCTCMCVCTCMCAHTCVHACTPS